MTTVRDAILSAVVRTLEALDGLATPVRVFRSRSYALTPDELPALQVLAGAESVDNSQRTIAVRHFDIEIGLYIAGDPADCLADPILAAVSLALLADPTLGGMVYRVVESHIGATELIDSNGTTARIVLTYTVTYATPIDDCTQTIRCLG